MRQRLSWAFCSLVAAALVAYGLQFVDQESVDNDPPKLLLVDGTWYTQVAPFKHHQRLDGHRASNALTPIRRLQLSAGTVIHGYELVERTALLGVCRPHEATSKEHNGNLPLAVRHDDETQQCRALDASTQQTNEENDQSTCWSNENQRLPSPSEREEAVEKQDGPILEYQCLSSSASSTLPDASSLMYVNANYRLRKKFDAGSHGEVWKATRVDTDGHERHYILKRLFVEIGAQMLEMGLREAYFGKLLANLPHVARFVEHFTHTQSDKNAPQELWLVFHDEGISLRHYLYTQTESAHTAVVLEPSHFWYQLRSTGPKGEAVLREIMRQVLQAVAALHAHGITHRDIKPSNILLHLHENEAPIVKLADFGSAVDAYSVAHLYQTTATQSPSQTEETREYQPPEVLFSDTGKPYDFESPQSYDLWSIGVVFLEMVLGTPHVFMISSRARAKLDAQLRTKSNPVRLKSYLLHVLTKEFCIHQPEPTQLHALYDDYALLVSDGCHFGRFNLTVIERDPMHQGLADPWALDLIWKLLQWDPHQRISAQEALEHAFFHGAYVCHESSRSFATKRELALHQAYLQVQRSREEEMAFVVREQYETPTQFVCPHCMRSFATIASCEQHMHARKHNHTSAFCLFNGSALEATVAAQLTMKKPTHENIGMARFQGRKKYMEDLVVMERHAELDMRMIAVIDGHLGDGAATYVANHVFSVLVQHLEAKNVLFADEHPTFAEEVALRQTFHDLQDGFLKSIASTHRRSDFSGCTLTLVLVFEASGRIVTANVGDSRAIALTKSASVVLSMDHWPHVASERDRIESSGGFVSFAGLWRVVGQLAVSRSIGDQHLRQYVTADPFISHLSIHDANVLIIASDGLWEIMSNEQVAAFVNEQRRREQDYQVIAQRLIVEAYARGSLDNIAVVLVAL